MSTHTTIAGVSSCRSTESSHCSQSESTTRSGTLSTDTPSPDQSSNANSEKLYQNNIYTGKRVSLWARPIEHFIERLVPSRTPIPTCSDATQVFDIKTYAPEQNLHEPVLAGLRKLIASFPDDKRLKFHNVEQPIKFPYALEGYENKATTPDIICSHPKNANACLSRPQWQNISLVFGVNSNAMDDPMALKHVTQLADSAQNILIANNCLFTFAVGLYGNMARIFRFDHASIIASPPFDYVERAKLLYAFLWRFVHPIDSLCVVVGADPTVQPTRQADWDLAAALVKKHNKGTFGAESHRACRWIIRQKPYLMYERYLTFRIVHMHPELFSRATTVWEAFKEGDDSGQTYIIKDAWREMKHRFEAGFYNDILSGSAPGQLEFVIPEDKQVHGIAKVEAAIDLGECECRMYDEACKPPNTSAARPAGADVSQTQRIPFYMICHRTISYTWNRMGEERSHTRLFVKTVGRPIHQFCSTRELIEAIRDAIKGKPQSIQGRIVDANPGFLGDLDYSFNWKMYLRAQQALPTLESWLQFVHDGKGIFADETHLLTAEELEEHAKQIGPTARTGTYCFMAYEILRESVVHEPRHDLESFYWVLLWLVLRHTDHDHEDGKKAWKTIFHHDDLWAMAVAKGCWLCDHAGIKVANNAPLTMLLDVFGKLCRRSIRYMDSEFVPLTYDAVLAAFQRALDMPEWPENDAAIPLKTSKSAPPAHRCRSKAENNQDKVENIGQEIGEAADGSTDSDAHNLNASNTLGIELSEFARPSGENVAARSPERANDHVDTELVRELRAVVSYITKQEKDAQWNLDEPSSFTFPSLSRLKRSRSTSAFRSGASSRALVSKRVRTSMDDEEIYVSFRRQSRANGSAVS
ncbi:uncharacterized protein FIBRA_05435 [Fibroporia radiculosa]|uniref:Fungal-type protein kinase domain-containing protein n=1 Tax=Fibroporia radiculosa TaxID=599839 RepID=J4HXI5_9APHY|nr:uncharacterized protein FIBRA_05435 [Fibroporia radiculosa]CCM03307.1 predicted protein [Fibroporia radiculosa]